ncbi:MAG TPA: AAA family ATPase [Streptosporangiaceae bacterium]|nr:AAA family ATPase [Streptosporangiaceae bacterium]
MGRPERPADREADAHVLTCADRPLVGRRAALSSFERAVEAAAGGTFQFVGLVGEPGVGKTRLLRELAAAAARRGFTCLCGRAAEFEQDVPFGIFVDALDDYLEAAGPQGDLDARTLAMLAATLPSLSGAAPGGSRPEVDLTGLGRYQVYRAIRRLLGRLAEPSGLVLILDDVHWVDDTSIELLAHVVRHPPRGRVLIAVACRPDQAPPSLIALAEGHTHRVSVGPLTLPEAEEFLGPRVSRARCRALYEASGGIPFYLDALARMVEVPAAAGDRRRGLPPAAGATLQLELTGLSATTVLVARAAAVVADEFEPALTAVAAEVTEAAALAAFDELVARDIVRTAGSAGRFRFRHPLVRHAVYDSAAAGWRLGAHARIADHLARVGAPATLRAHHVELSGCFGDQSAISTLVAAARAVAPRAPAAAARWLAAALRLLPDDAAGRDARPDLLLELARAQTVSGLLAAGRDSAREALRLLPPDDHGPRARAACFCAQMERRLGSPHQARAVLLDELHRIPDQRSTQAVRLRLRLVAESLFRTDVREAQAVLDLIPDHAPGWDFGLRMAVAAMRPLPALALGRVADAIGYIEAADQMMATAADEHLAEWLDPVDWLCWTQTLVGRNRTALRRSSGPWRSPARPARATSWPTCSPDRPGHIAWSAGSPRRRPSRKRPSRWPACSVPTRIWSSP